MLLYAVDMSRLIDVVDLVKPLCFKERGIFDDRYVSQPTLNNKVFIVNYL